MARSSAFRVKEVRFGKEVAFETYGRVHAELVDEAVGLRWRR